MMHIQYYTLSRFYFVTCSSTVSKYYFICILLMCSTIRDTCIIQMFRSKRVSNRCASPLNTRNTSQACRNQSYGDRTIFQIIMLARQRTYGDRAGPVRCCISPFGSRTGSIKANIPAKQTGTLTYTVRARTGPVRAPYNCLRAFYGEKIVRSPCLKDVHAQLSDTGCLRVYGVYAGSKNPQNSVRARTGLYGMLYDHPRVTGMLALTVPVNYPGAPCDLGINFP